MELFSTIAVILLTLVGYSSGNVLLKRGEGAMPGLFDLFLMIPLWWLALSVQSAEGKWVGIAAGLGIGLIAGMIVSLLRPIQAGAKKGRSHGAPPPAGKGFLAGWKRFALRMGNFQGRMFMGFFYFIVVTPFALLSKVLKDDGAVEAGSTTFWRPRPAGFNQLDNARNQF